MLVIVPAFPIVPLTVVVELVAVYVPELPTFKVPDMSAVGDVAENAIDEVVRVKVEPLGTSRSVPAAPLMVSVLPDRLGVALFCNLS